MGLTFKLQTPVFMDACALLIAFKGEESIANEALKYLDDPTNQFVVSQYLRLELLPKPRYNKIKEEEDFLEYFLNNAGNIEVHSSQSLSLSAFELACEYGISAMDALHVAAAKEGGAEALITGEKKTKPMFRVADLNVISLYGD